jgi:hypothetical protein
MQKLVLACSDYFSTPEDGGTMFLQNFGKLPPDCIISHPRREQILFIVTALRVSNPAEITML